MQTIALISLPFLVFVGFFLYLKIQNDKIEREAKRNEELKKNKIN